MQTFLTVVYIMVCFLVILVVLLQSGKGGGLGSALGGGASQQIFGGAGAGNLLTRVTAVCAALFMILAASLSYLSTPGEASLERALRGEEEAQQATDNADEQAADAEGADGVDPVTVGIEELDLKEPADAVADEADAIKDALEETAVDPADAADPSGP